ncbi:MAG: hypothetical protein COT84_05185 [Chlamydiae bacterium CG10_big_fil_rev_8_21_14_0_10_35_9]|nr:MAG: hypothetical protein COT84_05185 [Chlamydiae bacterium CG10_big_fil_rev_8_21_14_0_10_35_9]
MTVGTIPVNRKPPEHADNTTFYRQRSSSFQNFQAVFSGATQIPVRLDKIFKIKKDTTQVSEVVDPILKSQANNNQHRSTCCSIM